MRISFKNLTTINGQMNNDILLNIWNTEHTLLFIIGLLCVFMIVYVVLLLFHKYGHVNFSRLGSSWDNTREMMHDSDYFMDIMGGVPWKWDLQSNRITINYNHLPNNHPLKAKGIVTVAGTEIAQPEYRQQLLSKLKMLIDDKIKVVSGEMKINADLFGQSSWIEYHTSPLVRNAKGKPISLAGTSIIINRRRGNAENIKMLRQLQMAQVAAGLVPWVWDIASDTITYDREITSQLTNTPNGDGKLEIHGFENIAPKHRSKLRNTFDRLIRGERETVKLEVEDSLFGGYGQTKWTEYIATVLERDVDGVPTMLTGTATCIEERKQNEKKLMQHLEERLDEKERNRKVCTLLNVIFAQTDCLTWEWDIKEDIVAVNLSHLKDNSPLRFWPDRTTNLKHIIDLTHPDDASIVKTEIDAINHGHKRITTFKCRGNKALFNQQIDIETSMTISRRNETGEILTIIGVTKKA